MTDTGMRLSLHSDLRSLSASGYAFAFGSGLRRDLTSLSGLQINEGLDPIEHLAPDAGAR